MGCLTGLIGSIVGTFIYVAALVGVYLLAEPIVGDKTLASAFSLGVVTFAQWMIKKNLKTDQKRPPAINREDNPPLETSPVRIEPPASIRCFRCKTEIAVPLELRGQETNCPQCGTRQRLPK